MTPDSKISSLVAANIANLEQGARTDVKYTFTLLNKQKKFSIEKHMRIPTNVINQRISNWYEITHGANFSDI